MKQRGNSDDIQFEFPFFLNQINTKAQIRKSNREAERRGVKFLCDSASPCYFENQTRRGGKDLELISLRLCVPCYLDYKLK